MRQPQHINLPSIAGNVILSVTHNMAHVPPGKRGDVSVFLWVGWVDGYALCIKIGNVK